MRKWEGAFARYPVQTIFLMSRRRGFGATWFFFFFFLIMVDFGIAGASWGQIEFQSLRDRYKYIINRISYYRQKNKFIVSTTF